MTYLVDGYNVIKTTSFASLELELAREHLVAFCQAFRPNEVIVVFDGPRPNRQRHGNVLVVYAPSADRWLIDYVRKARSPRQITVVTEDRQIRGAVGAEGARVMSPREFVRGPKRRARGPVGLDERTKAQINEELKELWGIET